MGRFREEKRRRKKIREEKESEKKLNKKCEKLCFAKFCGSGGSKRRPSGEMRDEKLIEIARNCGAKMREAHFEAKMSKNVKNTSCSEQFWNLRCSKSARPCGAKHEVKMYKAHQPGTTFGS